MSNQSFAVLSFMRILRKECPFVRRSFADLSAVLRKDCRLLRLFFQFLYRQDRPRIQHESSFSPSAALSSCFSAGLRSVRVSMEFMIVVGSAVCFPSGSCLFCGW